MEPEICAAGTYSDASGSPVCFECPMGFYCEEGSVMPQNCPNGTYNNVIGTGSADMCLPCTVGHYCIQG